MTITPLKILSEVLDIKPFVEKIQRVSKLLLISGYCRLEKITNSDEKTQDRKRAFHLDMTYKAYSKRKAELMSQAEKLKGVETT